MSMLDSQSNSSFSDCKLRLDDLLHAVRKSIIFKSNWTVST